LDARWRKTADDTARDSFNLTGFIFSIFVLDTADINGMRMECLMKLRKVLMN
jgi:hypothetical protein